MSGIDILLIAVLAAALALAVRHAWKTRKTGGCGCGCEGCLSASECRDKRE